jgi:gametolysin peptidase M11/alpha-galactosidase-like protein
VFTTTPPSCRPPFQLRAAATVLFLGSLLGINFPSTVQAQAPAPQTQQKVTMEGLLEVLHEDREQGSRYHYYLKTERERIKLDLRHSHKEHQTGDHVRVKGVKVGQTLALDSDSSIEPLAQISPNTFGPQKTLVILVNFQDNTAQPYTPAFAQDLVFNTTSSFHYEDSYQQTWLEGDVRGWYTLPISNSACDFVAVMNGAQQAAQNAGVDLSAYNRFIYAFPQTSTCGWWGLGTVGGNPSHAWINGSLQLRVVGHETGHNLGLYHSHALECGAATIGGSCSSIEYGDTVDIMGSATGHVNAFQKEWLGWLGYGSSPPIVAANQDGVYSIESYEGVSSNPKAVKILKHTDANTGYRDWYYVEYRQANGFDGFLSGNTNVLTGVVIHSGSESTGDSSFLLDLTPATSSWYDPALGVGQSFQDVDNGVTITLMSADNTGATIAVSYGAPTCVPANPTVALLSQNATAQPGATVTYTVSVTNRDAACGTSTFNLQSVAPDGWTVSSNVSSLNIASGSTASASLQVTSSIAATSGSYSVGAAATHSDDPNYAGSTSAIYTVQSSGGSSVNVALSTNYTVYARKKAIPISARVTAGGLPVRSASVNFTVTKPDGTTVTAAALTKKSGTTVYKFRTTLLDPVGTYWVTADTANTGPLSGLVTASFIVQ